MKYWLPWQTLLLIIDVPNIPNEALVYLSCANEVYSPVIATIELACRTRREADA